MRERLIGVALIFIVLIVANCGMSVRTADHKVIEVEGMACVEWNGINKRGGLTCNWDEWKGEVD